MRKKPTKPNVEAEIAASRTGGRREGGATLEGGLSFERRFTRPGHDPFDEIEWGSRNALIANERGETVFEQRDVEIPEDWSMTATNVVVGVATAVSPSVPAFTNYNVRANFQARLCRAEHKGKPVSDS